nr:MAG TPA_asm: hypothetical protein [Caudoviricetes sp.]
MYPQSFVESVGYGKNREKLAGLYTPLTYLCERVTHFFVRLRRSP